MPNRIVRDSILTSERVASLGWPEEVFYRRLMSIVDDYGRHEAGVQLLRSRCYPLQTDQVRVADISRWMAACQKAGLVVLYEVAGKQYLQIENFGQQQRSASKCPEPPTVDSSCDQPQSSAPVFVFEDVSVSECVAAAASPAPAPTPKQKRKSPTTQLPEGFGISERVRKWAAAKGHGQLEAHLESFLGKVRAKDYRYVDWDEAFMTAIRDDWAKLRDRKTAEPVRVAPTEDEANRWLAEQRSVKSSPEATQAGVAALKAIRGGRLTA